MFWSKVSQTKLRTFGQTLGYLNQETSHKRVKSFEVNIVLNFGSILC